MAITNDMTVGSPTRDILHFSLPLISGYLLQQLYQVADAAIVGQCIGVEALAAVGASWSVMFLIMGFCNGACAGFAIPVAQAFGAKDYVSMRSFVANAIRLSLWIAVALTAATVLFCGHILRLISTPADIFGDARTYLLLQLLTIPFTIAYNLLASLLRALGNSKQPFYYLILSSLLNIILDALLIIVFHLGVAGAGIATMASQAVAAALCLGYILHKGTILIPHGRERRYDQRKATHLLANGVPMGLQFSITGVGIIMLQSANNALGTVCVASFTAAMRVKYLFTCVFENIGVAMATYCGQNIGAGKVSRIALGIRSAMTITIVYFVFVFAILQPFADEMMLLFVDDSQTAIVENAAMLMRISCWFYPILGLLTVLRYSIQGLGWSGLSMMSGVMEMLARGGVSLWLVPAWGFLGVCYGDPMAWVAADIFLIPAMLWLYNHLRKTNLRHRGRPEKPA